MSGVWCVFVVGRVLGRGRVGGGGGLLMSSTCRELAKGARPRSLEAATGRARIHSLRTGDCMAPAAVGTPSPEAGEHTRHSASPNARCSSSASCVAARARVGWGGVREGVARRGEGGRARETCVCGARVRAAWVRRRERPGAGARLCDEREHRASLRSVFAGDRRAWLVGCTVGCTPTPRRGCG